MSLYPGPLSSPLGLVGSDVGGDDVVEGVNGVAKAESDIVVECEVFLISQKSDIKSNDKKIVS